MTRIKFEKIKAILTSEYWLILTLSGAFFVFFALNHGGVVTFINLSGYFLLLNLLSGDYQLKRIPASHLITAAICIYLLLAGVLVSPQNPHTTSIENLVRMLCLVFAIHCLSQKRIDSRVITFFFIILSLAVCWQFIAHHLFKMPYGTFTHKHYLSSFAILSLPMIIYSFFITTGWYKFIFVPIAIMNTDILLQAGSRPAFLGIVFGTLFVFIFLTKGRRKWYGLTMIFLILAILYITEYADMAPSLEELIVNIKKEERVQIWSNAWNELTENSMRDWIFGHGIVRFYVSYTPDPPLQSKIFALPHLHFLEIVYQSGLIGGILIFGGLALVFATIVNAIRKNQNRKIRLLLKCLLVALLSWFIHSGLTLPFYSKYSLYPLAFILGAILVLVGKTASDIPVVHEPH